MQCKDCTNTSCFLRHNMVRERALYDGEGEFIEVLDADTVDCTGTFCNKCGSENLADNEECEECDRCGIPLQDAGDGYDGLCADCADTAESEGSYLG